MSRVLTLFGIALLALVLTVAPLAAQDGGVINWSVEGINDVASLDPARASDAPGFAIVELLHAGLVRLNEKMEVVPDLAESWELSEDGLTYTFTLKEGVAFSDGTPITSADVVWSLNHALSPDIGSWTGPYLLANVAGASEFNSGESETLSGVQAIDERTVAITISQPSAYFLSQLTFGPAKVLSQDYAEANPDTFDQAGVTSGAFSVAAWNRGQGLELVPNPNYLQVSPVGINIVFNQDSETAYQLYRTGGVDITGSTQNPIPSARVPEVQGSPEFTSVPAFNQRYVAFNNMLPPFDDVRVRQAFAHAIDRVTLADTVLGGTVNATDRLLPAGFPASDLAVEGLAFDPEAALALLEEAGINPADLNLTLTYGVEGDNERVVTVLASMWEENLGVNVTLEPLELSTFSSRLNDTYNDPATGLQAYYSVWNAVYPDPQTFLSVVLRTGVPSNNAHYSNPEFDALVDQADVIVDDFAARATLYNQAEQIAVTEVGWLPLFNGKTNVLVRDCIEGVAVTGLFSAFVVPDYSALAACP
jgi:oligopeptide transport system substrate-binding protein